MVRGPEGVSDIDRDRLKRLHLPVKYPAPDGGCYFAVPGRMKAICMAGGEVGGEGADRRHRGGACRCRDTATAAPLFGVLAASGAKVRLSLPPESAVEH